MIDNTSVMRFGWIVQIPPLGPERENRGIVEIPRFFFGIRRYAAFVEGKILPIAALIYRFREAVFQGIC